MVEPSPTEKGLAARTAIAAAFDLWIRDLDIAVFPRGIGGGRGFFSITFAPLTPVG
ncbi:hypothetical protein [Nocardia africana]|uniref:Uncharacterized protein n=1 Tax=Nocardia africana TaxID=134964 RepID=A0ABW6NUI3_9NOCA